MYPLETIQDIRKNSNLCVYCLESTILDTIQFLESTLIVPNVSENFQQQRPYYSKSHDNHDTLDEKEEKYSTTSSHFSSQRRNYSLRPVTSISPLGTKYGMNAHQNSSTNSEDWTTLRSFKSTVFTSPNTLNGIGKDLQTIRIALNKLSTKTFTIQKDVIMQLILKMKENMIEEELKNLEKIGELVFEIASSNKMYSDLYADLYHQFMLVDKITFHTQLQSSFDKFRSTFDTIVYKDPNVDYDGFCIYIKENDRRRAFATFLVSIAGKGDLNETMDFTAKMMNMIEYLQTQFITLLKTGENKDTVNISSIAEEMSEVLFLMITVAKKNSKMMTHESWNLILDKVKILAKTSTSILKVDYPYVTSRIVFKQLDLYDALCR